MKFIPVRRLIALLAQLEEYAGSYEGTTLEWEIPGALGLWKDGCRVGYIDLSPPGEVILWRERERGKNESL